jgi:hypothetical protein
VAFVVGLSLYMIAMVLSVYDGVWSLIFQPIMGSVLTIIALIGLVVVGSPLLGRRSWAWWARNGWISFSLAGLGLVVFVLAWHQRMQVQVFDPQLGQMIDQPHPGLGVGGWLAVVFAVLWCPKLGFVRTKRWL